MKIGLLAEVIPYGIKILEGLEALNMQVDVIFLVDNSPPLWKQPWRLATWWRRKKILKQAAPLYKNFCDRVLICGRCDSQKTVRIVRKEGIDCMILGGVGIIPPSLIEVPSKQVVNAHPGLLPWFRGSDVVAQAVLQNKPVGASLHVVDAGVDTGALITQKELSCEGISSLKELEEATELLCIELICDYVSKVKKGNIPKGQKQTERFPLYHLLPKKKWEKADALFRTRLTQADKNKPSC